VHALSGQSTDLVSVGIKSPDRIRQIRHASAAFRRGGLGGIFGDSSDTFSNGCYIDSATVSRGQADATDDTFWSKKATKGMVQ
jgi:hypothetical protein